MRILSLLVAVLAVVAGCGDPVRTTFRPDAGPRSDATLDASGDGGPRCVPRTIYCEGTGFTYQCDETGAVIGRAACEGDTPTCVPEVGCRVCRPGDRRCNPGNLSATQSCRMDGTGWVDGAACNVDDGESCVSGVCAGRCSESALGRSYLGCDYWPTVTPNSGLDPMFSYAVVLSNPQTYEVRATITGGALTEPRAVTLAPGAVETVELPWVLPLVQLNPSCVRVGTQCAANAPARSAVAQGGAYHVHTNGPIAAYQFNPLTYSIDNRYFSYSNDASLLLPQGVLTQHYTVLAWPDLDSRSGAAFGGFVSVVATSGESTTVTVRASTRIRAGTGVAAMTRGETREFSLQAGDVLQLLSDGGGDITGTTVESTLPVAVFVGNDCANVPQDRVACDHMEEQLFPNETWGTDYIVSALRDRGPMNPYVVRVFARTDGTRVTFDPEVRPPTTLSAGQVLEFQSRQHFRVTGSQPFLVAQYMIGQGDPLFGGSDAGDPASVLEVPVQQYRDRYDFFVPSTYPRNFINIVVPTGATLTLDDQPVRGSMELLGEYTIYTLPIESGPHHLASSSGQGAGIKIYGIARYTSYMYPGGLDLRLIAPG